MMSDGRHMTDYRTAVRREEYNKMINKMQRDDDYRMFLQNSADQIMDSEWSYLRANKSCWKNNCVHNYPTRVYPPWFVEERKNHDARALNNDMSGKNCQRFEDYRLTTTRGTKF